MRTPDYHRDQMEKELLRLQIERIDPTNKLAKKEEEKGDGHNLFLTVIFIIIAIALAIFGLTSPSGE